MSLETNGRSCITSVSLSLGMKWSLKAKQLKALQFKDISAVHSDLYKFKNIKDLNFSLCLEPVSGCLPRPFKISVEGPEVWSFQLIKPFIVIQERPYHILPFDPPIFMEQFDETCILDEVEAEENVTVHCVLNICVRNPIPRVEAELTPLDCRRVVDIEIARLPPLPRDYANQDVIAFMRKGEIPVFTVDMAIRILFEAKIHQCEVLKILCMEYLMNRTNAQNLRKILGAAISLDLPELERSCTQKILLGCFRIS